MLWSPNPAIFFRIFFFLSYYCLFQPCVTTYQLLSIKSELLTPQRKYRTFTEVLSPWFFCFCPFRLSAFLLISGGLSLGLLFFCFLFPNWFSSLLSPFLLGPHVIDYMDASDFLYCSAHSLCLLKFWNSPFVLVIELTGTDLAVSCWCPFLDAFLLIIHLFLRITFLEKCKQKI